MLKFYDLFVRTKNIILLLSYCFC
uniref:Uncharacterized protein n=1 Tax=Arundo donax TaxID=35708 RepID=A0A0A8Z4V5_ARUDO